MDIINALLKKEKNSDLSAVYEFQKKQLPTLWLLGKTGAGKSSLIQTVTNSSEVEIGNGFAPCTKTSSAYDFPQDKPVLRFLDTRGLGDANYDPSEDISLCSKQGHVLLIVAKIDEPEQSAVVDALKQIQKQGKIKHLLMIHTAIHSVSKVDKNRMLSFNQDQFEKAWGGTITKVEVDFDCDKKKYYHLDALIAPLSKMLPIVDLMMKKNACSNQEEQMFNRVENEILWYSSSASASDLVPAVGLISVPTIQAKMFHSLANQYHVEWNKRTFSGLLGTLGASFAVQYGVKLGTRQLVKLIPLYGQSLGAVTAAAMSFGTTYALGRAACYYFYYRNKGETVNQEEIQKLYKNAFNKCKKAASND